MESTVQSTPNIGQSFIQQAYRISREAWILKPYGNEKEHKLNMDHVDTFYKE